MSLVNARGCAARLRRYAGILIALSSLAASLLAAEVCVRLLGAAPECLFLTAGRPWGSFVASANPRIRYVPIARTGDLNRAGMRDYDYPENKPEGAYRILVIGDSIPFGICGPRVALPKEATFPKILEEQLGVAARRRVEVINMSVPGYDTEQEIEYLRLNGLNYRPDNVILSYCLNDTRRASGIFDLLEAARKDRPTASFFAPSSTVDRELFVRSALYRLVRFRLGLVEEQWQQFASPDNEPTRRALFARLGALARENNFSVSVVIFPFFKKIEHYDLESLHHEITEDAQSAGFPTVDLLSAYQQALPKGAQFWKISCDGLHPNREGHEIAAKALATYYLGREDLRVPDDD